MEDELKGREVVETASGMEANEEATWGHGGIKW